MGGSEFYWQNWANYEALVIYSNLVIDDDSDAQRINDQLIKNLSFAITNGFAKNGSFSRFTNIYLHPTKGDCGMLYDDRQWLALSMLSLYKHKQVSVEIKSKLLADVTKLYDLIINTDMPYDKNGSYLGLFWAPEPLSYHNAITNELFFVMTARLFDITKNKTYLANSLLQYTWLFKDKGIFGVNNNSNNNYDLFLDGYHGPEDTNTLPGGGVYTYNQGVVLEGLAYLAVYDAANADRYINLMARIINSAILYYANKNIQLVNGNNSPDLIMHEYIDHSYDYVTQSLFKGIFFRHLTHVYNILNNILNNMWDKFLTQTPLLFDFVIVNAQAVAKYTDMQVDYDWDNSNFGIVNSGTKLSQLYVLMAAKQLFNVKFLGILGVGFDCDNNIKLFLNLVSKYKSFEILYNGSSYNKSPIVLPYLCNKSADNIIKIKLYKNASDADTFALFKSNYKGLNIAPVEIEDIENINSRGKIISIFLDSGVLTRGCNLRGYEKDISGCLSQESQVQKKMKSGEVVRLYGFSDIYLDVF